MSHPRVPALVAQAIATLGGVAFLASLVWTAAVVSGDFSQPAGPWTLAQGLGAIAWNASWFGLFALHHSLFARARVKQWVADVVSAPLERSVYVWVASALLALAVGLWLPVPGVAWHVEGPMAWFLLAAQIAGIAVTLLAVRQLDIWSFSGMRQARGRASLQARGLYRFVRHPIYFAWLLIVWPAGLMTGSRLTFAAITTLYLVLAVPLEERGLVREFGPEYDAYRRRVRWRMLPGIY